jgi:outer membrane protein assembly factor BamA
MGRLILILLLAVGSGGVAQAQERLISARDAKDKVVKAVHFKHYGERPFKNSELRGAMRTLQGQPFERRFFSDDLKVLRDLYRGRGYRSAEILRTRIKIDAKQRLSVSIEIDSKEKWRVGPVRIEGATPFAAVELMSLLALEPGQDLDYARIIAGEREIQRFLNSHGYPHAKVRNQLEDDLKTFTAGVVYYVEAGPKLFIGEIHIDRQDSLHTRGSLVRRYMKFNEGDLYDPVKIAESRNQLARTGLFRSVSFSTPVVPAGDSLQPIHVRLQEKKYIVLGANFFLNTIDSRVVANMHHNNWLGRGAHIGVDGSLGKPLQGVTLFWSERNLLKSGADLTVSTGVTEQWIPNEALGNFNDPEQFELLTTNDSVLRDLLSFPLVGEEEVRQYFDGVGYEYESIERVWEVTGGLSRSWKEIYRANLALSWRQALDRPVASGTIIYSTAAAANEVVVDPGTGEDGGFFEDDGFFEEDDGFFEDDGGVFEEDASQGDVGQGDGTNTAVDYSSDNIPIDGQWRRILEDRSRALNLTTVIERDTRDDRISPTRGSYMRLSGLYAVELNPRLNYVVDGEAKIRWYQPLRRRLILALAAEASRVVSLRKNRALNEVYYKRLGGEGSVRGVERETILVAGGGRVALNLRSELRYLRGKLGLVGFWDQGGVWRRQDEVALDKLTEGYGIGFRYIIGFPLRLDLAWQNQPNGQWRDAFGMSEFYLSIGQAF